MKKVNQARDRLESAFFRNVPKSRRINPFFRKYFDLFYDASHTLAKDQKLLNIYSSADLSAERECFFKDNFFSHSEYHAIDFWKDQFLESGSIPKEKPGSERYLLEYPDNFFDCCVTTKVILEHVTEPYAIAREIYRVLKPGGRAFLIAPHIRRQHQAPYDYFRFTEYALNDMFVNSGFRSIDIDYAGGFMAVVGYYAYFFQRGLPIPSFAEKMLDILHYWIIEPVCYYLDRFDNGYGRDMTLYFMIRLIK